MLAVNNPISISWPKAMISKIDSQRGDIPRSKYLLRMVEKTFETIGNNESKGHTKKSKDLLDGGLGSLQSSKSMTT